MRERGEEAMGRAVKARRGRGTVDERHPQGPGVDVRDGRAARAQGARVLPRFGAAEEAARLHEVTSLALPAAVLAERFGPAAGLGHAGARFRSPGTTRVPARFPPRRGPEAFAIGIEAPKGSRHLPLDVDGTPSPEREPADSRNGFSSALISIENCALLGRSNRRGRHHTTGPQGRLLPPGIDTRRKTVRRRESAWRKVGGRRGTAARRRTREAEDAGSQAAPRHATRGRSGRRHGPAAWRRCLPVPCIRVVPECAVSQPRTGRVRGIKLSIGAESRPRLNFLRSTR